MNFLSVFKRIAPFVLTFAFGLLIASFFVTVSAPRFEFKRGFNRHREYHRQMELRNSALEAENERLQKRVQELEKRDWVLEEPSFKVVAPPPPPAVMPMKTVPSKSR